MATINSWNNIVPGTAVSIDSSFQISATGVMTNANQPAFAAYCASDHFLATGDGTLYTIPMDTAIVNQGSNFNTGTFTYTVPTTGIYLLNLYCSFRDGVNASNIDWSLYINANGTQYNICAMGLGAGTWPSSSTAGLNPVGAVGGSILASLTATNTVLFQIIGSGGTKIGGVVGGQAATYCSGYLVA